MDHQSKKKSPQLTTGDVLLVIDMQNDFLPGGALAVPEGDQVIPTLRRYIQAFQAKQLPIFASRDWHPADHGSFKAQGGPWPPHCVQGSHGAQFVEAVKLPPDVPIISSGYRPKLEGYSSFEATDLNQRLKEIGTKRLFVGGLATDYCVFHTVKEARQLGYEVWLLEDAVRAVNLNPDDGTNAIKKMIEMGTHTCSGKLS